MIYNYEKRNLTLNQLEKINEIKPCPICLGDKCNYYETYNYDSHNYGMGEDRDTYGKLVCEYCGYEVTGSEYTNDGANPEILVNKLIGIWNDMYRKRDSCKMEQ